MKNKILIYCLLLISGRVYTAENRSAGISTIGAVVGTGELFQAITDHDHAKVVAAFTAGASANAVVGIGFTRTMLGVALDAYKPEIPSSKEIIRALLQHGAQANGRTPSQEFPLYTAVKKDLYDIVELLLQAGAREFYIPSLKWAINPENKAMLTILLNKKYLKTRIGMLHPENHKDLLTQMQARLYNCCRLIQNFKLI